MDRLLDLRLPSLALVTALAWTTACEDPPLGKSAPGAVPSRFQSVKDDRQKRATDAFCEKSFPATGPDARRWVDPPARALPPQAAALNEGERKNASGGWKWVNLWASWCGPCLKELPLLSRWREALAKDGLPVRFELWSVDASEAALVGALGNGFPGELRWLQGEEQLGSLFEALGIDKASAIPVHALIDPKGQLRCVRVGSIGEESYGAVRAILAGG